MTTTIERRRPGRVNDRRRAKPASSGVREAPFVLRDANSGDMPDDGLTLDGYGAVFNSLTTIDSWEGVFREQIAPGSMRKSFRESPPIVQFDHGRHPMIGSIPIADLKSIREESDPALAPDGGAHIVARVFDNWLMQPVREAIAAKQISGMSFRFEVIREKWQNADGTPIKNDEDLMAALRATWNGDVPEDELPIRTLQEVRVPEMGPVVWPAYSDTSVGMRNRVIDLSRLDEPGQRKLLARAVFIADSTEPAERDAADGADADDDPAQLAGALDAILDEAAELIAGVDLSTLPEDVAQALNLLIGAETVVDELLEAMGVYDPDDDEADEPRSKNVGQNDAPDAPRSTAARDFLARKAAENKARAAGKHPSAPERGNLDAPQSTDSESAAEHPSQPKTEQRHRLSKDEIAKEMARTRTVLLSIPNTKG